MSKPHKTYEYTKVLLSEFNYTDLIILYYFTIPKNYKSIKSKSKQVVSSFKSSEKTRIFRVFIPQEKC